MRRRVFTVVALVAVASCVETAVDPQVPTAIRFVPDATLQSASAGSAVPVRVEVYLTGGNPAQNVRVSFTVASGGGSLSSATAMTSTIGVATTTWVLGPTVGSNSLRAVVEGVDPVTLTVSARSGPPASITADPGTTSQTGVVGRPVPEPPSVVVKDALGNPVVGVEVRFDGGAVSPATVKTSAVGRAKAETWTLGGTVGAQSIFAHVLNTSLPQVEFRATAAAGPPRLIVTPDQVRLPTVGETGQLSVRFEDAFGNPVAGPAPVSFSSSNASVATVSSTGVVKSVAGGTASILATADTLSATIPVFVSTHIEAPLGSAPVSLALLSDNEAITTNGSALKRVNLVSGAFGPFIGGGPGAGPGPFEIVVDAAREFAYIANSKHVSVVRLSTNLGVDSIVVPGRPTRLIAAPGGQKLYVGDDSGHVHQIDVATRTTKTFRLATQTNGFTSIIGLAVTSDGATLYASSRNGRVYRVRTADGQILGSAQVGGDPAHAVLSLDGTELYVANQSYPSAWVDVLDAQSLQLKKRVDVPGAFAMALHPDGRTLFVLSPMTMYVFSPATMTIRYSCPFPSGASQMVFTSDGRAIAPTEGGLDILPKQP